MKPGTCHCLLFALMVFGTGFSSGVMYVDGRFLYDPCGEQVVLRGANVGTFAYSRGIPHIAELAKTGANCARLTFRYVINRHTPHQVDSAIQLCVDNNMIAMPCVWDATGKWDKMDICIDYWCQPEMVEVLQKNEDRILLNIANEGGNFDVTDSAFREVYGRAVKKLRGAGLHVPLVIDASGWGRRQSYILDNAEYLIEQDPERNLLFSWHPWDTEKPQSFYKDAVDASIEKDICMIFGEFSQLGVFYKKTIDYQYILQYSQEKDIGWLVWWWNAWKKKEGVAEGHSLTDSGGLYGDWANEPYGEYVTVGSEYSIQSTSKRTEYLENRACGNPVVPDPPQAPSDLHAVSVSGARVDLSWKDNSDDERSFAVEYRESGESDWILLKGVERNATGTTVGANNRNYFFDWTTDRDLSTNTTYSFRIAAYKSYNEKSYSNEITVTTGDEIEYTCGSGTGLTGRYYNKPEEGSAFETEPVITRVDSVVDFNWKNDSPGEGLEKDHFHVLWTGQIEAPFTDYYTIYANTDEFSKVWLNGERIIVNWWGFAKGYAQETRHLEAGRKYNIRFEFRDWTGPAKAELYWATSSMEKQIIPRCFLHLDTGDIVAAQPPRSTRMVPPAQGTPGQYMIYSISGRLIATIDPATDSQQESLTNGLHSLMRTLPKGVYAICRKVDRGSRVRRGVQRFVVR